MIGHLAIGHQRIDLGHGDFLTHGGKVEIDGGRLKAAVSQILLDLPQVDAGLQEMGGERARVWVEIPRLDHPSSSTTFLMQSWTVVSCHRLIGGRGLLVIASFAGEEPLGIAMRGPVLAEHVEGLGRESGTSRSLCPLPRRTWTSIRPASISETCRCRTSCKSQPERIDGPEEALQCGLADGVDQLIDFGNGEDGRQLELLGDAELVERGPFPRAGVEIEELDPGVGDLERIGFPLLIVLDEQQVAARDHSRWRRRAPCGATGQTSGQRGGRTRGCVPPDRPVAYPESIFWASGREGNPFPRGGLGGRAGGTKGGAGRACHEEDSYGASADRADRRGQREPIAVRSPVEEITREPTTLAA